MNKIVMKGTAASIRWSYHLAAALGAWTIEGDYLSARLLSHDAFKLSQQPLTFVVTRANNKPWVYALDGLTVLDGQITATIRQEN